MATDPYRYQPSNYDTTKDKFANFVSLIELLRSDEGCPWDRALDIGSLREKLVEEVYETVDAINSGDYNQIADELGDLLLHVVMHANIAHSDGKFGIDDVIHGVTAKLIRRHPHVFGDAVATDKRSVENLWSSIKNAENNGRIKAPASMSPMEQNIVLHSKTQLKPSSTDTLEGILQRLHGHTSGLQGVVGGTGSDAGAGDNNNATGVVVGGGGDNNSASAGSAGDNNSATGVVGGGGGDNNNAGDANLAHTLGMVVSDAFAAMVKAGVSPLQCMTEVNKSINK